MSSFDDNDVRLVSEDPTVDLILKAIYCLKQFRAVQARSSIPIQNMIGVGARNTIDMETEEMARSLGADIVRMGMVDHVTRHTEGDDTVLTGTLVIMTEGQLTFMNSVLNALLARNDGSTMH